MNQWKQSVVGISTCLFVLPASAPAQQPVVVGRALPSAVVSYADLNLANPAGVSTLQGRIRRAARGLCLTNGIITLRESIERMDCMDFALAGAMPQLERAIASAGTQRYAQRATIRLVAR